MAANNGTDERHSQNSGDPIQTHGDNGASHSNSNILIIIIAVTSLILLIVLSLIIIMLRRLKSLKKSSNRSSIKSSSGEFTSLRTLNYNSSPGKLNWNTMVLFPLSTRKFNAQVFSKFPVQTLWLVLFGELSVITLPC